MLNTCQVVLCCQKGVQVTEFTWSSFFFDINIYGWWLRENDELKFQISTSSRWNIEYLPFGNVRRVKFASWWCLTCVILTECEMKKDSAWGKWYTCKIPTVYNVYSQRNLYEYAFNIWLKFYFSELFRIIIYVGIMNWILLFFLAKTRSGWICFRDKSKLSHVKETYCNLVFNNYERCSRDFVSVVVPGRDYRFCSFQPCVK